MHYKNFTKCLFSRPQAAAGTVEVYHRPRDAGSRSSWQTDVARSRRLCRWIPKFLLMCLQQLFVGRIKTNRKSNTISGCPLGIFFREEQGLSVA